MSGAKRRRQDEEEAHAGAGGDEDGLEEGSVVDEDFVDDAEEGLVVDDMLESGGQEAGTLQRLVVKNLMCHKKLKIDFNRHVNFIVGRNGAGKSAICAAIQLVFGASATETDRGDSLGKMVRTDSNGVAEITLTLSNKDPPGQPGAHSFKHDEYGDAITIVRKLRQSGANRKSATSSFETLDSSGQKKKTGKAAREEVAAIRDTFNIQATNPLVVITQETSKKFAVTDGTQKFKMLMKATQLQAAYDNIIQTTTDRQAASESLANCKLKLKAAKMELKAAKHEFQRISQVKELAGRVRVANVQQGYAEARAVLVQSQQVEAAVARLQSKIADKRAMLQQNEAQRQELDALASQKLAALDKLVEEAEQKRAAVQALRSQRGDAKSKLDKEKKVLQRLDDSIAAAQAKRAEAERTIAEKRAQLEARSRDDPVARAQQRSVDADGQLRDAKAAAEAAQRKLRQWEAEDDNDLQAVQTQLEQQKVQLQELRSEKSGTERSLAAARANGTAFERRLRSLGLGADRLYEMVQSNLSKFSSPPFGPLAAFVEMKEEHKQWARAVASSIHKYGSGWVVANAKDMQLLRQLARRAKVPRVSVDIFKVPTSRIDLPPAMVVEGELRGIDCIDTSDPVTYNVLVEVTDLAQTVFAPEVECQTRSLLENRECSLPGDRWPRRALAMTCDTGRSWRAKPGATIIQAAELQPNFVAVLGGGSQEAQIEQLQEHLEELAPQLQGLQQAIEETEHRASGLQRAANRMATANKKAAETVAKLSAKAKKCRALYERAQRESDDAQTIDFSEEEAKIDSADSELRDLEADRPELVASVDAAKGAWERLEAEVRQLSGGADSTVIAERRSEIEGLARQEGELVLFYEAYKSKIDRQDAKHAALSAQLDQYRAEYAEARAAVDAECADIVKAYGDEVGLGDPSTWNTSVEECKGAALAACRALRAAQEAANVSDEERQRIEQRHTQAIHEHDKIRKRVVQAKAMIKSLKSTTQARFTMWQEVNQRVQEQASTCFRQLMMRKGHVASMRVVTDEDTPDCGEVVLEVAADAAVRDYREDAYGTAAATQAADTFDLQDDDDDDDDHGAAAGRVTGKKRGRDTSRDVGGLSGGEKSFTSLCLLCAITKEVEVPFQVMDEFDVFMDEGTRLSAMEMLLGHADETNRQFIFITPHDISSAVDASSDKVAVLALAPPVRD